MTGISLAVEKILQHLNERIKELASQLRLNEIKYSDAKEDIERLRKELARAESVENELRRTVEQNAKIAVEYNILRDQVPN